jgi:hypothetical protein
VVGGWLRGRAQFVGVRTSCEKEGEKALFDESTLVKAEPPRVAISQGMRSL